MNLNQVKIKRRKAHESPTEIHQVYSNVIYPIDALHTDRHLCWLPGQSYSIISMQTLYHQHLNSLQNPNFSKDQGTWQVFKKWHSVARVGGVS